MRVFNVPVSVPFLRTVIAALVDGRLVEGFEARTQPGAAGAGDALSADPARRAAGARNLSRCAEDAMPRSCRASSRSATSTRTNWPSPKMPTLRRHRAARHPAEARRAGAPADAGADWSRPGPRAAGDSSPLVVGGPASTLALAGDLARLMDDMVTRGVDWNALDGLVPDAARQILAASRCNSCRSPARPGRHSSREIGRIEPAARRDLLIEAEAARLTAHHDGPVIAAGSTGSMPATAKFLHAVAKLPQGAVVLPGLDTDLDDDAWQIDRRRSGTRRASSPTPPASNHPQFAMHALLRALRHQARRRRDPRRAGAARPRGAGVRSDAAVERHRAMARPAEAAGYRRARSRAA